MVWESPGKCQAGDGGGGGERQAGCKEVTGTYTVSYSLHVSFSCLERCRLRGLRGTIR